MKLYAQKWDNKFDAFQQIDVISFQFASKLLCWLRAVHDWAAIYFRVLFVKSPSIAAGYMHVFVWLRRCRQITTE